MSSGPAVPNASQTSQQQTQSNIQTATAQQNLGMVNQSTPFGNLQYSQIGKNADGTPKYQATTTLTPQLQNLLNSQMATGQQQQNLAKTAGNQAAGLLSNPLNAPSYNQFGGGQNLAQNISYNPTVANSIASGGNIQKSLGTNDYSADRQKVEDALMGRLNTQYDKDRTSLEQNLASKGIQIGSEAYRNAMGDYGRSVAEGRTSAILGAGQEQNRLQDLALNAGNFANNAQAQQYSQNANNAQFANNAQQQAYQQALQNATFGNTAKQQMFDNSTATTAANNQLSQQRFQDQMGMRNNALNNFLGLQGGQQVGMPQFAGTPQAGVAPTDVSGNAWNSYNAQQQQSNQFWNGLGAVGSAVGGWMFSDERLKTDKTRVGETPAGTDIYSYRYKGSPMMQVGVMAQDVKKTQPEAVRKGPGGFLQVNYRRVA